MAKDKKSSRKVEGHQFFQPFQQITTYEQALAKTRAGTVVGALLFIQGALLSIAALAGFAEAFGLARFNDEVERWSMFAFVAFFGLIGLALAILLHRYQWWWVVIALLVLGTFDFIMRLVGVFGGGANFAAIIFAVIELVAMIAMVRGRRVLKRMQAAKVDTTVFE
jgi:multisubunit Na+/H+ antiporter MnhG subunit